MHERVLVARLLGFDEVGEIVVLAGFDELAERLVAIPGLLEVRQQVRDRTRNLVDGNALSDPGGELRVLAEATAQPDV